MNPGRPTVRTQAIIDELLVRIAEGESVRSISRSDHMPTRSTLNKWLAEDPQLSDQYARATQCRADVIFDEIFEIADDSSGDFEEGDKRLVPNHEHIQRARLRVDARKWALARMSPREYGDRVTNVVEGGDNAVKIDEPMDIRRLARELCFLLHSAGEDLVEQGGQTLKGDASG